MDFVVLDTEGKLELSELAIVDSLGRVIYEAFSKNHPNNTLHLPNLKSLTTLLVANSAFVLQGREDIYARE
ncbi:MAG: hypothetical protein PUP91_16960 [Rhizonema sp. PD37]|nr:hypothetical protein [Rhizonema sp. PD37]